MIGSAIDPDSAGEVQCSDTATNPTVPDAGSGNQNKTVIVVVADVAPAAEMDTTAIETVLGDPAESEGSAGGMLGKMDAASAAETTQT